MRVWGDKMAVALLLLTVLLGAALAADTNAVCVLRGTDDGPPGLYGVITFSRNAHEDMVVKADIRGLSSDGQYAMHVHEWGDITDTEHGLATGSQYISPLRGISNHGCPPSRLRRAGDMGNWDAFEQRIEQTKTLDLLRFDSNDSILGRSVVLYRLADSCNGESGKSGLRIGQCVIGRPADAGTASPVSGTKSATCQLVPTTNCRGCHGTVWLREIAIDNSTSPGVQVTARVKGLVYQSVHGFHIHTWGDMRGRDGSSFAGHWNPTGALHNLPERTPRHLGDLGNIQSYEFATNSAWYRYNQTILTSLDTVIGRAMVVHMFDDHGAGANCNTANGNAGVYAAVCVIGIAPDSVVVPDPPIRIHTNFTIRNCTTAAPALISGSSSSSSSSSGSQLSASLLSTLFVLAVLVLAMQ